MARLKIGLEDRPRKADARLVERLADELKASRQSGQPFIYEESYKNGNLRILVIWDDWKDLSLEERTNIILAATDRAEGEAYRDRVALVSGLTVPEAVAAGMLPYQIIAAHRKTDPVTLEQCREAMLAEGASQLLGPNMLQLRFPTEGLAEACRQRLAKRLPGSDDVWAVLRDMTAQDLGPANEVMALGCE